MKNEDGVAAVVALMLLLAVIVTFLSLYATTYLPALKQQAEIEQITSVKEAFMRFDNDMDRVLSEKETTSYGETIRLGGGDILLNPEKSSGTVSVEDTGELFRITVDGSEPVFFNSSTVSFEPSFSYWEKQGYSWQYGYINVTKGKKETPLSYNTMDEVTASRIPGYAGRLLELSGTAYESNPDYLRNLTVTAVTIERGSAPGEDRYETSGNGACVLRINASVNITSYQDTRSLAVTIADSPLHPGLAEYSNHQMNVLASRYSVHLSHPLPVDDHTRTLIVNSNLLYPVTVTVKTVTIAVYVR
ncbi:MAG: hypothetical protein M0R30_13595 [Methanoregula sp.]|uniref:hypothetical protein n=1 Tax=Methanoregula sp. TaxID=2052170 RepID=UPI0025F1EE06|nr:hypothetical protein [Methanoregula sp.]MCK9632660.1 hypothetical protein [Methanoregula sp.]